MEFAWLSFDVIPRLRLLIVEIDFVQEVSRDNGAICCGIYVKDRAVPEVDPVGLLPRDGERGCRKSKGTDNS